MYKLLCIKTKDSKRCIHCLEDFRTQEYTNYCPNIETCPNGNWNFQCPECAKEWASKEKKCPMCKTNLPEEIIIELQSDNEDIEKKCIYTNLTCSCSCNCQTSIFPEDFEISQIYNNYICNKILIFCKVILGIILFELTGIFVSSLWIYIFVCGFNIYEFNEMVIQDLWKQWIYYCFCPIVTCVFILVLVFCLNCINWCKTHDSIMH